MTSPMDAIDAIMKLIELGKEIRSRYKIYAHANEDLKVLDGRLGGSIFVLEIFQKIIERGLNGLLRRQQADIGGLVDGLQSVFDRLDKQLSRLPSDGKFDFIGKVRWTFGRKSGYEAILQELKAWQSEVHDVVDAIKLLQDEEKEEDRALYKRLFEVGGIGVQRADVMDDVVHDRGAAASLQETDIDESSLTKITKDGDRDIVRVDSSRFMFIERRYFESRSSQETLEAISDVRKLASVLHQVDMDSMHILHCKGIVYQPKFERSLLLYDIPRATDAGIRWTLAKALEDVKSPKPPLDVRVRYALEVATAVMFTHAAGLVHKSICPDNILILRSPTESDALNKYSVYLAGFDAARLRVLSAYSEQVAVSDPVLKVYQHPERQTDQGDGHVVRFGIRHDMYSLGIVLLEIGAWKPLAQISKDLQKLADGTSREYDSIRLQKKLIGIAGQSLAGLTGTMYADTVVCCLKDSTSGKKKEREMREVFYEKVL